MIRIGIVDDQANNRTVIKAKLALNPQFDLVLEAVNGEDFFEKLRKLDPSLQPHIVLMDLEMPVVDGVSAIASASSLYPGIRFVVLTIFDDDEKVFRAIRAGACGYLLKEESGETLHELILQLWENGAGPISPSIAYKILQMVQQTDQKPNKKDDLNLFQLSDREKEILQSLCDGFDYKEIGARLFISHNTVKKHCISIYQKLHVNSKAQALRIAFTKGLI